MENKFPKDINELIQQEMDLVNVLIKHKDSIKKKIDKMNKNGVDDGYEVGYRDALYDMYNDLLEKANKFLNK